MPLGRPVYQNEIYDPTTTRTLPDGTVIRDPFEYQGQLNMIPPDEFSKATMVLLPLYRDPQFSTLLRNQPRYSAGQPQVTTNRTDAKIDHEISPQQKLSGSFHWNRDARFSGSNLYPPFPGYPMNAIYQQITGGDQERIHHDWTINDHTLNVFALGHNRFFNTNNLNPDGKYTPSLGISGIDPVCFPSISFNGHVGNLTSPGGGCVHWAPRESFIAQDTFSHIRGKHSLKFGGEFRRYHYNAFERGPVSGSFSFSDRATSLPGFAGSTGHPFASFILGAVDKGSRSIYLTEPGYRFGLITTFFQDDFKATSKLTLNLKFRWEIPMPQKEAFNRMSGFDATLSNPGADGIPGALAFLGSCHACNGRNSFQDWYFGEAAPRFGIAYQAAKNLVLRGGYEISYGPPIENNFGSHNIFGFNSSINLARGTSPTGFSLDPVIYWSQLTGASLPTAAQIGVRPYRGTLPNLDPTAGNGNGLDFLPRSNAQPYVQVWSAGFQYQLPSHVLLEVNYVGNKGTRLQQSIFANMFNAIPTKYMPLGDMLSDDLATDLADPTTRPILAGYGITKLPYPSFEDTSFNPTVGQALRPFSQFDVLTNNNPYMGSSTYHALQVTAQRRVAHGLDFIASYTFSKTLTDTDSALYYPSGSMFYASAQDFYNRKAEKSIASFDYTHFLKLTWIYALPFGKGQRWLSSVGSLDRLVRGWSLTAIQQYHSGDPIGVATEWCSEMYGGAWGDGCSIRPDALTGVPSTVAHTGLDVVNGTPYLNPAAFPDPPVTPNGIAARYGSAPRFLPNVRGPSFSGEDFAILKDTMINERVALQFRGDLFNLFNRTELGDPVTDTDSGSFGLIFGPAHGPRVIQLAMRLNF
jgi:hypothetical protein